MGVGYMIALWGKEEVFIPHHWEGFRRNEEDYRKVDNPENPKKPLFYFEKPIQEVIEDISEPEDRITIVCMDPAAEFASSILAGSGVYKSRYIFPISKEEIEETQAGGR